eukprot:UN05971
MNLGLLEKLGDVLKHKIGFPVVLNLMAKSDDLIEEVLKANLFPLLIEMMSEELKVYEIVVQSLCRFIQRDILTNKPTLLMALDAIETILSFGKTENNEINDCARWIIDCGGYVCLQSLESNELVSNDVSNKVSIDIPNI